MRKLINAIAPLLSVYDMYFIHLLKDHDLADSEQLAGTVRFVLADPLLNVQRNRSDEHADYDGLDLKVMKNMGKVLGDVMKPGAHGQVFCSAPKLAL